MLSELDVKCEWLPQLANANGSYRAFVSESGRTANHPFQTFAIFTESIT